MRTTAWSSTSRTRMGGLSVTLPSAVTGTADDLTPSTRVASLPSAITRMDSTQRRAAGRDGTPGSGGNAPRPRGASGIRRLEDGLDDADRGGRPADATARPDVT